MLQPGTHLWLTTKHTKPNTPAKLESSYEGPYRQIKQRAPVRVELELNGKAKENSFHIRDTKRYHLTPN
jgi:hypothetical protein